MLKPIIAAAALVLATHAAAQVTFYEQQGFRGRALTTDRPIYDLGNSGFNDRASSVIVERGRWEACEHAGFAGRCIVLGPGQYPSLSAMGMNNLISSVRPAGGRGRAEYTPAPVAQPYAYYPRHGERLFQTNVTSVRAVVGPPQQRCWVEREQVVQPNTDATIPGAIIGGVLGGVLGHQIGGGHGQDVATALGAVGGAAVGANVGRGAGGGGQVVTQDVQRCHNVPGSAQPQYWDVTYWFRGQEHRVQLSAPPGPTITVNQMGEPRM